ncbi:MAG TPA: Maf family protein [Candidatus Saccharimonadales bacterium]|nr:Maf family protein [Candidatus Saccharimonadales bacterium]
MKKIILASSSPRRKHLLEQLGLQFTVFPSEIEEKLDPNLQPIEQVEVLSLQKAKAVAVKFPEAIIIAADTMVAFGNEVIGKPKNESDAIKMLKNFSGNHHVIVTGFSILDAETKKTVTRSTETKVWFREMTSKEITSYVRKEKPYDKAGAYAIHEFAGVFIKKIEGDCNGGTGLSIYLLAKELKKFGIDVLE